MSHSRERTATELRQRVLRSPVLGRDRLLRGPGTSALPLRVSDEPQKPTSPPAAPFSYKRVQVQKYQDTGFQLPAALPGTEQSFSLFPVVRGGTGNSCDARRG